MSERIDYERVGQRTENNTVFPIEHVLARHEGALGWTVTEGQCNGTADRARSYKTRAPAVRAWEKLVGRGIGVRTLPVEVFAIGIHAGTHREMDEGYLAAGTLVRAIALPRNEPFVPPAPVAAPMSEAWATSGEVRKTVRYEASTDGGTTWFKQYSYWTQAEADVFLALA